MILCHPRFCLASLGGRIDQTPKMLQKQERYLKHRLALTRRRSEKRIQPCGINCACLRRVESTNLHKQPHNRYLVSGVTFAPRSNKSRMQDSLGQNSASARDLTERGAGLVGATLHNTPNYGQTGPCRECRQPSRPCPAQTRPSGLYRVKRTSTRSLQRGRIPFLMRISTTSECDLFGFKAESISVGVQ